MRYLINQFSFKSAWLLFCVANIFNSMLLLAAEPPKLILPTVPQAAIKLELPVSASPTEVTTGRLEFNGFVAPKEVTTNQLEFNGYVAPKEITTGKLEFNGYTAPNEVNTGRLEFNGYVAPKEVTTNRLEFNGKTALATLPKTELLKPPLAVPTLINTPKPAGLPPTISLPNAVQPPISIPAPAQAPVTNSDINTIKQLPLETAPTAPKSKPFLLKPKIVSPQN
jgi:hypothetical protein